jgi:peptidyl-prolyl cis-trans isomerase B (cyclophilin B)
MKPPSERRNNTLWWIAGAAVVALVLAVLVYIYAFPSGGAGSSPAPSEFAHPFRSPGPTVNTALLHPPVATPMASPLAAPAGDGTTATLHTDLGDITFEVYNQSAPVASENFINLADAGFYNNLTFHRIVPGFVIQGGDPNGDGSGGPPYGTIPDEPVVGDYTRGIVAMARTAQPNSAGSQFFIVLDDSVADSLPKSGGYVIFGNVTSGMEVVDQIALTPNSGDANGNQALDPTYINTVTIQPGTGSTPTPAASSSTQPAASPSAASSTAP